MGKREHVDSDVETALKLRRELVDVAVEQCQEDPASKLFIDAFRSLLHSRVYVWEPPAIDAFWRFWSHAPNYKSFLDRFMPGDELLFREDMINDELHMFPAPGKLFGEDTLDPEFADSAASIIFPPTTRAIAVTGARVGGLLRLPAIIETVQLDLLKVPPPVDGVMRLEKIPALPRKGTPGAQNFMVSVSTRAPRVVNGKVRDTKPIQWLICMYQLQIFLAQSFLGFLRKRPHGASRKQSKVQNPAQEIVQVLMREPLPIRIPRYVMGLPHPITGRTLEYEVDVRSHERHCASGVITTVKAHKRGPRGITREKVIKVIR